MKTSLYSCSLVLVAAASLVACGDDTSGTGGGGQGGDATTAATTTAATTTGVTTSATTTTTTTTTGSTASTTVGSTTTGTGGSGSGGAGGAGGGSNCLQADVTAIDGFAGVLDPNIGGPLEDFGATFFDNYAHTVDLATLPAPADATEAVFAGEDFDPDVGYTGSLFYPTAGTLTIAADGWTVTGATLIEYSFETFEPIPDGRCLELSDFGGAVAEPFGWLCDPGFYDAADGCDCACGLPDPDCDLPNQQLFGCLGGQTCDAGLCVGVPDSWTCDDADWDDGTTCNCECGAEDPDCDGNNTIVGCPNNDDQCIQDTCVPADETGLCADFIDNDQDNSLDCGDSDCSASGDCTPGATPRDGACALANECDTNMGNDPLCITADGFGTLGDFCSEWCTLGGNDCGAGALCLDVGLNEGVCLTECIDGADCDPGFDCVDLDGMGTTACLPGVPVEWTCDPGFFGAADGCDCGCGAVDPDCADATDASCEFCEQGTSCGNDGTAFGCDLDLIIDNDNSSCPG